jgi:hypothetical protein
MSNEKPLTAPAAKTPEASVPLSEISKIIQDTTVAVMAAMNANNQANAPKLPPAQTRNFGDLCPYCRQYTSACGGKEEDHVEMVVYPTKYPEFGEFFPGYIVNGVKYLSNDESHAIVVPKVMVTTAENAIREYEENERVTRVGRRKDHNSGHIANARRIEPHNAGVAAWR